MRIALNKCETCYGFFTLPTENGIIFGCKYRDDVASVTIGTDPEYGRMFQINHDCENYKKRRDVS